MLLAPSNSKLGNIPSWSLPAGLSCPGKTALCRKLCYASKLERIYSSAAKRWLENLAYWRSNRAEWRDKMTAECRESRVIRIHVSGDFHSVAYINDWIKIIQSCPNTVFFAYTRVWSVKRLQKAIHTLKEQPNIVLFASWDETSADIPPAGWRISYMGIPDRANYRFLLCPNAAGQIETCLQCGVCFNPTGKCNVYFPIH